MDLDTYKKTWDNQPEETNSVSKIDIYKMAHSKSSSVVKWVFILGVIELSIGVCLNLFVPDSYIEVYNDLGLKKFINFSIILNYIIIVLFLFLFYKNYKAVSSTENTKRLLNNILRVRRTVKYYIYYNLTGALIFMIIIYTTVFSDEALFIKNFNPENLEVDINTLITSTIITLIVVILVVLFIIWLFYRVTYGILLGRLKKNYKELDSLEHLK